MIFTHVFLPKHRASRLDLILFTLPTFYVFFILFPIPYLPHVCLVFSSISCSQQVAKLGPNIFILSQSDQHPFSVLLRVQKSSFHDVVPSDVKPCNRFEFPHSSSLPAATASHFVHSSLVDQLYVKEVYFYNFVAKSNNLVYPYTKNSSKYIQQFPQNRHSWRVLRDFHKSLPLKRRFHTLYFTIKPLPTVIYQYFLYQNPQNN